MDETVFPWNFLIHWFWTILESKIKAVLPPLSKKNRKTSNKIKKISSTSNINNSNGGLEGNEENQDEDYYYNLMAQAATGEGAEGEREKLSIHEPLD